MSLLNRSLLVAAARQYVGTTEDPPGSNRAPLIDQWNTTVGSPLASPWCMAFAWCMGNSVYGTAWPVVKTGRVQTVVDWAGTRRLKEQPQVGDLMVLYFPTLERYAHTGIVVQVENGVAQCAEGNTIQEGQTGDQREGYGVFIRVRRPGSLVRFVAWDAP